MVDLLGYAHAYFLHSPVIPRAAFPEQLRLRHSWGSYHTPSCGACPARAKTALRRASPRALWPPAPRCNLQALVRCLSRATACGLHTALRLTPARLGNRERRGKRAWLILDSGVLHTL